MLFMHAHLRLLSRTGRTLGMILRKLKKQQNEEILILTRNECDFVLW